MQTGAIEVDWNGRCETPAGAAGQVRPHRSYAPRRLTARPAESEQPAVEINHSISSRTTKFTKRAYNLNQNEVRFLFYMIK